MRTFLVALASVLLLSGAALAQNDRNDRHDRNDREHRQGANRPGDAPGPFNPGYHPGVGRDNSQTLRQGRDRMTNDRQRIDRNLDRFRGNYTAERRFHAGNWNAPRGYAYRHWSHGQRLPSNYFARNFWIMSFGAYGLLAPPPDAVWVRYGPDALLVDRVTGEIIRVQYGVFY